ncbi:beta-ketoacyl synthase N-terminal-like domain-containing protein, partial [Streptomyces sp. NPDC059248]|uniref:type I polyketide synthase n=1 Tax=Streptomyces sp. NPDC059248 TaxID=3346791 RepID=UPI003684C145
MARRLVEVFGVRRLVLVSRRGGGAPGAVELGGVLGGLGCEVVFEVCDVGDRGALAGVLGRIPVGSPLVGVVHTAGILDDGVVTEMTPDQLERVLRPKAEAAWHLHELTEGMDLSLFVLYSSMAGLLGTPGQANYAAANTFLDALAAYRRARGLPGQSLAWGLWEESGSLSGGLAEVDLKRMARMGLAPLSSADAMALFDQAVTSDRALVAATRLDLTHAGGPDTGPALLRGLAPGAGGEAGHRRAGVARRRSDAMGRTPSAGRLDGLSAADRRRAAADLVRTHVAAVLGHHDVRGIPGERALTDLGFDSLTSLELRNRLTAATGLELPATLAFDHPSLDALTAHLVERIPAPSPQSQSQSEPEPALAAAPRRPDVRHTDVTDDPVVIVGMACRFPGGVGSPGDLWDLVVEGREGVGGFPVNRGWDLEGLFHSDSSRVGTSSTRRGGFLYGADEFDAGFFGMSPREALATDPQQRVLLETAWELFENAGIDPLTLKGSRTGVYTGVMYHDYGPGIRDVPPDLEGYFASGTAGSVASGRLAYWFGFEGPAVSVDTACSSSLVAL